MIRNLHEMTEQDLIDSFIEVRLSNDDDFLKIRETLTRMGVKNKVGDTIFQSCHILHKRGKYYIVAFKELFALDGRLASMTDEDIARRNTIARTLERWGLCTILTPDNSNSPILAGKDALTIIPHKDKKNYNLEAKYRIGSK